MIVRLAAWVRIALLALVGCGSTSTVPAPPGDDLALALIASTYEEHGIPVRLELVSVVWWEGPCLARYRIDTDHWEIQERCVRGVAPGCWLHVVLPAGERPLSRSSLAHEVLHCAQYQHEIVDLEHARPEWGLVVVARQRVAEAGL